MALWQFAVLVGLLVWIGIGLRRLMSSGDSGWEYSIVNISETEVDSIENRLNELGRSRSELVMIWSPNEDSEREPPEAAPSELSESDEAVVQSVIKEAEALGLTGQRSKEIYAIFKRPIPS
jgi:hypothetical protein